MPLSMKLMALCDFGGLQRKGSHGIDQWAPRVDLGLRRLGSAPEGPSPGKCMEGSL